MINESKIRIIRKYDKIKNPERKLFSIIYEKGMKLPTPLSKYKLYGIEYIITNAEANGKEMDFCGKLLTRTLKELIIKLDKE